MEDIIQNKLSKYILALFITFSIVCFASQAHADQGLSILAGKGLTFNNNSSFNGTGSHPGAFENSFIMGFEYSHSIGPTPFSWNATFITSDVFLLGLGFDLYAVKVAAKVGYGLSNGDSVTQSPNSPAPSNYGFLGGFGLEVPVASNLGITANYVTNNSYLGGIVIHW